MAWWNRPKHAADTAAVADAKSSQLPQLPSASATPTTPKGLAAKSPTPPSATIRAGGTLPESSGAVPASYPTTPYPAIAPIRAVSQTAIPPSSDSAKGPINGSAAAQGQAEAGPVQTGPYTSGLAASGAPPAKANTTTPPQQMPEATPMAAPPAAYDHSPPAYRTADTRAVGSQPYGTGPTLPNPSSSQPTGDVGDRYATPSSTPASYRQSPAAATSLDSAGPENRRPQPTTPSASPDLGTQPGAASADRYPPAAADRYGSPPASQTMPPSHPAHMPTTPAAASGADTAITAPPTSGVNGPAIPATELNPPAATSAPSPAFAPQTGAPAAKPAPFRPGGTSDYHRGAAATSPPTAAGIGNRSPGITSSPAGRSPVAATGYPPSAAPAAYPPLHPSTPTTGYPQTNQIPGPPPVTSP